MPRERTAGAVRRIPGEGALAIHAVVALFVGWLAPHGFPIAHPRFWTNSVAPVALALVAGAALVVLLREKPRWAGVALFGLAGAWLGGSIVARAVFPVSLGAASIGGVAAGLALVAAALVLPERKRLVTAIEGAAAVVGLVVGAAFLGGLRPPPPTTQPLDEPVAATLPEPLNNTDVRLQEDSVAVETDGYRLSLSPLLTFDRVSPDGFWSLLAPAPRGRLLAGASSGVRSYDDGARLTVAPSDEPNAVRIAAFSPTPAVKYTHLNSYCVLTLDGFRRPGIAFSPTGARQFDVLSAGYPTGAPARFACLEAGGAFTVREASSGEKGPFRELASGPHERNEPVTMRFFDGGDWVASLTLDDWSAQASTALSPTAGWGMPQNAIEFQLLESGGPVSVWVSLAATSVGRGWDTVGHRAGVYRNRCRLEWRSDSAEAAE